MTLKQQLMAATGCTAEAASRFALPLAKSIDKYGVKHVPEFLAQLAVESAGFRRLQENLNYTTPERIMEVWPSRFPTVASAMQYVRHPRDLANFVYSNRIGNGPPESNDGWNYRGRGLIQLTGLRNYAAYERASLVPVVTDPGLLLLPHNAADSAGWYWKAHDCDALAGNILALTRRINGGLIGLKKREAMTKRAREALAR